jgi:hypothetical protein
MKISALSMIPDVLMILICREIGYRVMERLMG